MTDYSLESYKHLYDYFKHLTTLDTGALVILATFFTKSFDTTTANWLVGTCLTAFIVSLVNCIGGMNSLFSSMGERVNQGLEKKPTNYLTRLTGWELGLSTFFFLLGTTSLMSFVLVNIKK
ncbi:MAG: hypothetical protein ABSB41_11005 [Anaerolineales bacterium]